MRCAGYGVGHAGLLGAVDLHEFRSKLLDGISQSGREERHRTAPFGCDITETVLHSLTSMRCGRKRFGPKAASHTLETRSRSYGVDPQGHQRATTTP